MMHMKDLLSTTSLLFIITSFTLLHIPKSFSQDQQQFETCSEPFRCGNIDFSYPFWGGDRPESCGYPGFNLSCQGDVPRFTVGPVAYRILSSVDTSSQTVTVARDDLWDSNCPQSLHNTTLNFNIFSYPNTVDNITLYYNCTQLPTNLLQLQYQFNCTVNSTAPNTNFFQTSSAAFLGVCTDNIRVPINRAAFPSLFNTTAIFNPADLRTALTTGFPLRYEASNTACNNCSNTGGRCGYDTRSNSFACYPNRNGSKSGPGTAVVLAMVGAVLAGLGLGWLIFWCRQRRRRLAAAAAGVGTLCCFLKRCSAWEAVIYWKSDEGNNQQVEAFMRNYGSVAPKLYKYSEIKKMTNSFAKKLGLGGYGSVYRGKLSDGRLVAVKVLNDNNGNGEEFINEVASISRTSHVNVVNLLGFCYDRTKRALIYEFMPNGSLDKFIYQKRSSGDMTKDCQLEWKTLYEIAVGTARGLEYLHKGCNTRIVHLDIKPHNILLDKDFCPKISDFGLARLCKQKQSILSTIGARGTAGYIAPEVFCRSFGGISHKSDVYSYGMMLLEIVGLRRKIGTDSEQTSERYFPDWIYEHLELGKDLEIQGVMNEEEEDTSRKMILVGLWCIQTNPTDRPPMGKVVEMLEGSLEHLKIPPKPFPESPPMARESTQESWTSSI
ncbi:LEAF RUST 10 DISEASE-RESISTANCEUS RECEPTOR-LIKE PROTEIN KINASE-like 2.1 isoform X1 [Coffea arabica]|uniref:non-specific serine/threonine protein kinase n=1 Tax=Coffea arabica TaxID=13443 RepID=A0ABM4V1Q7_COFAR